MIMLLHSASQLLTIAGVPQRGSDLGRLGIIPDGAVLICDGVIKAVGTTSELCHAYTRRAPGCHWSGGHAWLR
jgi:imidazolonepropionase